MKLQIQILVLLLFFCFFESLFYFLGGKWLSDTRVWSSGCGRLEGFKRDPVRSMDFGHHLQYTILQITNLHRISVGFD